MLSPAGNRSALAVWIIGVLAIVGSSIPAYDLVGQRMDEGALLLYPELILKGWLPYRDFETFYGPANAYLLAAVYAVFHPGVFVERTVGLVYHLTVLAAIFRIVRPRGVIPALGAILIAHLFLLPTGLAAFPWLGAIACALWSILLLATSRDSSRSFVAGILASAALLFRPDLGLAVIFSAALLLFFEPGRTRRLYSIGFSLGLLAMLCLIYFAGLRNVFDNLFLYPAIVTNPARKIPWGSVPSSIACLLAFHFVAAFTNMVAGFLALRKDSSDWSNRAFAAAAIFILGTSHQALQRMDGGHVTLCCFLSLALFPVSLEIIAGKRLNPPAPTRQLLFVAVILVLVQVLAPGMVQSVRQAIGLAGPGRSKEAVFLENNGRSFPVDSMSAAHEAGALLDKVSRLASTGQRLFVGPGDLRRTNYNDTFLYYLLPQLTPATYFLEMNPLSANRPGSRLADDVRSADWVILDRRLDAWNEPNDSKRFGPDDSNEVVQSLFELQGRYGSYDLYRRK